MPTRANWQSMRSSATIDSTFATPASNARYSVFARSRPSAVDERVEVLGEAVVAHAAIASRGVAGDAPRLQHHDPRSLLGERKRRRQPGESGADDDDIRVALGGPLAADVNGGAVSSQ